MSRKHFFLLIIYVAVPPVGNTIPRQEGLDNIRKKAEQEPERIQYTTYP